jgi:hypothetical protein
MGRPRKLEPSVLVALVDGYYEETHEDNYYVASATLPWNGQFDAAQTVLRRASLARPFDFQPAFYYAFNLVYFRGDATTASAWLRAAAAKLKTTTTG